jgi:serine/threonine protein kinase/Tfp pilus assembly protein PilF
MNKSVNTSDFIPDEIETVAKCPRCGATNRLDHGTCINCFLREGLETKGEGSREAFESVLVEANVTDTQWRLGHYEILEEIGRGGMGVIYRARQQHSRRIVAVKRIFAHEANSHETLVRFRREAEAVASLDHPNILPIHEVSESEEGLPFFSMKYATGGSLRAATSVLRAEPRECVRLMAKVARAIAYAHGKGILHRDLQPGNILLDENGEPMVSDFGLAKWLDQGSDLTRTLETLGTPGYIAPEQAERPADKLTCAADVYSLGAIGFYLLTGRPPFVGSNVLHVIHQAAATPAPRLCSLAPSLDRDLETIIGRCLESDPAARYQSAGALAEDLEHWLRHEPIRARRSGIFTRGRKWVRRNPSSALLAVSLIALAVTAGWIVWKSEFIAQPVTDGVAVLPFENLSPDPDNAYFANGIQEEILTRLASIADLKVISHTSTQQYQSKPRNLREIAKQLGVPNILEGSVQKVADQVRVNVQLINAQTDSHLWADTYDRKLTDIFGVESEIAKRIAGSLQAKLTGREEQALAVKPTNNPEAYDAYLRGLSIEARSNPSLEGASFYERAVQLDPNFAVAWARLSRADAHLYSAQRYTTPARGDAAKGALESAQKLEPNSAETLLALGYYQYRVLGDNGAAKTTFERVGKMLPSSSEVPRALGTVTRWEGQWDQSIAYFEKALALDPRNEDLLTDAALTYAWVRQFPAALKLYDRALDIMPNDPEAMAEKASMYQAQGNVQEAAKFLTEINAQTPNYEALQIKITQLRLERNYGEAIRLLQSRLAQFHYVSQFERPLNQVLLACMQHLAGDSADAKATAEQACNTLQPLYTNQPDNIAVNEVLSLANAVLMERDSALKEAERAITLSLGVRDAVNALTREEHLAVIQTILGENSLAISTLARLLRTPYDGGLYYPTPITAALLRLDPFWDPLRTDPAFQKLCQEKQPPATP